MPASVQYSATASLTSLEFRPSFLKEALPHVEEIESLGGWKEVLAGARKARLPTIVSSQTTCDCTAGSSSRYKLELESSRI